MKRFLETNFFLLLGESRRKAAKVSASSLEREYEKFSVFLFEETKREMKHDGFSFHQVLCYTRVELSVIEGNERFEKKRSGYPVCPTSNTAC